MPFSSASPASQAPSITLRGLGRRLVDQGLPGEVEMDAGQEFAVNPQIKGAIKSLDGVWDVEDI